MVPAKQLWSWVLAVSAVSLWPLASVAAPAVSPRPNILLMYVDNVGYGDFGCYGSAQVKTPRIDQLSREGVRCTDFYVVTASCTPSRGAILTGRYPARNGLRHQLARTENWDGIGLPHRERILPQYLRDVGYATACFGKWNIGFAPGSRPLERGFDEFFGFRSGNIHYFAHTYLGDYDMFRGHERHRVEGYSTELFATAAVDFIRRQPADQPWFVYLPFNAAHYVSTVNTAPGEEPRWHVPGKYLERYGWPADDQVEQHRYWALLTALDDAVGQVLDTVDARQERDRTLVMLISDMGAILRPTHGLGVASNRPFRDGAPSMYEGGVRVPAMFRWPGQLPPGTTCGKVLTQLDVLPLCLQASGAPPLPGRILDGYDPTPILRGQADSPYRRIVYHYSQATAVRLGDWKIVQPAAKSPWELYNLSDDPGEQTNLAERHPERVRELLREYEAWTEDTQRDASPATRVGSRAPTTRAQGSQ